MAFAQIEPFGEIHADLRAGKVCATVAAGSLKKEGGGEFAPGDFFGTLLPPAESEIVEELDPEAHSRLIMAAVFGKTD